MSQKFAIEGTHFSNTQIYVLHPPLAWRPRPLPQHGQNRTGVKKTGVCRQWNHMGSCACDKDKDTYPTQHKCPVCTLDHPMLHCAKRRNPIPSTFWQHLSVPHSSTLDLTTDLSNDIELKDTSSCLETFTFDSTKPRAPSGKISLFGLHGYSHQHRGFNFMSSISAELWIIWQIYICGCHARSSQLKICSPYSQNFLAWVLAFTPAGF